MSHFKQSVSSGFARINAFLDQYVLPWPVRFLTFRFVILGTIALLFPLILYAGNTVLVLAINSYLNTMSVAVSSIVLLYATISDAHQKQIAEMQEKRAEEDHEHVTEMHQLVIETLSNQRQEIETLKQMIADMQGQVYTPAQPAPTPDLRRMHPLGSRRFDHDDSRRRLEDHMVHSPLVSTIRDDLLQEEEN